MAFMNRTTAPATDGDLAIVRMLRHFCATRDQGSDASDLSCLVALGQSLRLPPVGCVALASVFQLTEAVLGRRLVTECCCSRCLSGDERAVLHLIGSPLSTTPGTATPEIPHGLQGALTWAILSFRRLCGDIVPMRTALAHDGCPFAHADAG